MTPLSSLPLRWPQRRPRDAVRLIFGAPFSARPFVLSAFSRDSSRPKRGRNVPLGPNPRPMPQLNWCSVIGQEEPAMSIKIIRQISSNKQ